MTFDPDEEVNMRSMRKHSKQMRYDPSKRILNNRTKHKGVFNELDK